MKRYLEIFNRVASQVRLSLQGQEFEFLVGSWLNSVVLKVQRRHWTEKPPAADPVGVGIFFSVWVEEQSLSKNQMSYNIHALRLRQLSAYSLRSREFAVAFRARFAHLKKAWPNVSVEYGPQTLMQGWIALDKERLEENIASLIYLFVSCGDIIDGLLKARKATWPLRTRGRKRLRL